MIPEHNNDINNSEFDNDSDYQDDIVDGLLSEMKHQREELKVMIMSLEKIKDKVDGLFPDTIDRRFVRLFEEKVKAATGLFNSILDIRKEIMKSLKDEIEIRRKITAKGELEDADVDIEKIATRVEKLNSIKKKMKEKI